MSADNKFNLAYPPSLSSSYESDDNNNNQAGGDNNISKIINNNKDDDEFNNRLSRTLSGKSVPPLRHLSSPPPPPSSSQIPPGREQARTLPRVVSSSTSSSKAVNQVQELMKKHQPHRKPFFLRPELLFILAVGLAAGIAGIVMHLVFPEKMIWAAGAYLYLYLLAVVILSFVLTWPITKFLIDVWNFIPAYKNYVYYYVHGTRLGFYLMLAGTFPWIYWVFFVDKIEDHHDGWKIAVPSLWITRVFKGIVVLGAVWVVKEIVSKTLAGRLQATTYSAHVRAILFLEKTIAHLVCPLDTKRKQQVPHKFHLHNIFSPRTTENKLYQPELSSSSPLVRSEARADADAKAEAKEHSSNFLQMAFIDLAQMHLRNLVQQIDYLPTWKSGGKNTPTAMAKLANENAKKIYHKLDPDNRGYITSNDFKAALHMEPDAQISAEQTFEIFDQNSDGVIFEPEMAALLMDIYKHRRMLQLSLNDSKSIQMSLEEIVSFAFFGIAFICELSVFGVDVLSAVIALSSVFLALSFALAPVMQALFFSFALVFFVKPFSVGDKISIESSTEKYVVQSISLWSTDTLDTNGQRHYFYNATLATAHLVNYTRTSTMLLNVDLGLSIDTPSSVVATIKERVVEYVQGDTELFDQDPSVEIDSLAVEKNMMTVNVCVALKCGWFDTRRVEAKQRLVNTLHQAILDLGLEYIPPKLPVQKISASKKLV